MTLRVLLLAVVATCMAFLAMPSHAFCGFYVGKADATLFNDASRVIYVRDGSRSVITMANDYRGTLAEFAMVVPVPTVLAKDDIKVVNKALVERIDAYSAPRLAEYFDSDPCRPRYPAAAMQSRSFKEEPGERSKARRRKAQTRFCARCSLVSSPRSSCCRFA